MISGVALKRSSFVGSRYNIVIYLQSNYLLLKYRFYYLYKN